jgi:hypothetical protein
MGSTEKIVYCSHKMYGKCITLKNKNGFDVDNSEIWGYNHFIKKIKT